MGEILLPGILAGSLSLKVPIKKETLSPLKRPVITKSKLTETENVLISQSIPKETQNEQPISKKHKKLLFEDCQIVLDLPASVNIKERQLLRRKILDNGGSISYIVTRNSTIVISAGEEVTSLKQKLARKYGVPVVSEYYIDECLEEQRVLDTKEFLVSEPNKSKEESFFQGKIIADSMTDLLLPVKPKAIPLVLLTPRPYEELHGYTLVKAILLKDRRTGMNKRFCFYVLELHTSSGEKDIDAGKRFCVCTDEGYLDKEQHGNITLRKRQCYYLETADDALSVYSQLYFSKAGQPRRMIEANDVLHPSLGTPEFQKLQLEWSAILVPADEKILFLVDVIWTEAIGHLNKFLAVPPELIPLWKVDEAEGILRQISSISSRDKWEEMAERLSVDFYSILPHNLEYAQPIVTKKILSQKQDLCQVLRDMVSISEASGLSSEGHLKAKYRALRCQVENLMPSTEEYEKIKQLLIDSQHHATGVEIQEIYSVHRYLESAEFMSHLPNKQLLFHATSPSNLVGILSQGLNLPKIVVQERGVDRFDIGMLGGGIYYTNSLSTCVKYSKTSKEKGTRFLLVSEVALGNVYETTTFDTSLTAPPNGFDSVHGIKATESVQSDFVDDEFVIYSPYQQYMHYLVEFILPEDEIRLHDIIDEEEENDLECTDPNTYTLDIKDACEKEKTKQMSGLQGRNAAEAVDIPLKEVHVRAKLVDLVAQVVVFQEYKNLNTSPLECKYVFPLESGAAVCGFEAYINNKHVVGEIKRKTTAHKEYKEAIRKGHGAYLMDEESPDVFTVSVGNIPPLATVIIKITYVLELPVNDEVISFNIPTSVAPWIEHQAAHQVTQDVTDSVAVEDSHNYSIEIFVDMPFPINTFLSPTNHIIVKCTETMAVVKSQHDGASFHGFSLLIGLKEMHVPRMWTEVDEDNNQAHMVVFYPEFEVKQSHCSEIIIVLDASNSMKGDAFQSALQVAVLCLMEMPNNCYFNVVAFGTVFQELFPTSQERNHSNVKKAKDFLKNIMPSFGNTELFPLLRYYNLTARKTVKNVIIISDGHINNEGTVLRNAKMHCSKIRLFTCGISSTANKHILCQLACWGGGAFEHMDPTNRINWKTKVKAQMDRATQTALTNVRIKWIHFNDDSVTDFLQAPQQIMSIFSGSRQVIYGFIPDCSAVTLFAEIDGKEYETMASSYSSTRNVIKGENKILHTLAARAVIRDWEDGLLAADRVSNLAERKLKEEKIVELSTEYNLVTSITSFIAVEKRDVNEENASDYSLLPELLEEADVDKLDGMCFEFVSKGQLKTIGDTADKDRLILLRDTAVKYGRISKKQQERIRIDSSLQTGLQALAYQLTSPPPPPVETAPNSLQQLDARNMYSTSFYASAVPHWSLLSRLLMETAPQMGPSDDKSTREQDSSLSDESSTEQDSSSESFCGIFLSCPGKEPIMPIDFNLRKDCFKPVPHDLYDNEDASFFLRKADLSVPQYTCSLELSDDESYKSSESRDGMGKMSVTQEEVLKDDESDKSSESREGMGKMSVTQEEVLKDAGSTTVKEGRSLAATLLEQDKRLWWDGAADLPRISAQQYQQYFPMRAYSPSSPSGAMRSLAPVPQVSTSHALEDPTNYMKSSNLHLHKRRKRRVVEAAAYEVPQNFSSAFSSVTSLTKPEKHSCSTHFDVGLSNLSSEKIRSDESILSTLESASLAMSTQATPFGGAPSTLFQSQQSVTAPSLFHAANFFPCSSPPTDASFGSTAGPLQISSIATHPSFRRRSAAPALRSGISLFSENTKDKVPSFDIPPEDQSSVAVKPRKLTKDLSDAENYASMEDSNNRIGFKSCPAHPQSVGDVLKFLKDLLKGKGGLPLCNAVDRHVRAMAMKKGRDDVIKFMDSTMKLDWYLPECPDDVSLEKNVIEMLETCKQFAEKIKTNGYCEELDCLRMGIMEPFARILEDGGLNSLGNKAVLDIKRMLATLAAIMYFLCAVLMGVRDEISGQHNFQKLENLSKLLAYSLIDNDNIFVTAPLLVALKFVRNVEQNHSLVYKSLNCGSNWEEFIIDYIKRPTTLPKVLSWKDFFNEPEASSCYIAIE